ncbi:MAG: hypothetical protein NT061_05900 [Spirochaetes bacterium]|nr:hypothetical protein [Spirochaetota bacterium]
MTFSERMKEFFEKSVGTSKDFLSKAGNQAQTWGEMGKLKFEILQLRAKGQSLTSRLGAEVYNLLIEKGEPMIGVYSEGVAPLIKQLKDIEREISEKESAFKLAGGADSDLDDNADK